MGTVRQIRDLDSFSMACRNPNRRFGRLHMGTVSQIEDLDSSSKKEVKRMYLQTPVKIPEGKGVRIRKVGDRGYVQYVVKREWDPIRKSSRVDRRDIGIQIPGKPELMLPNENYMQFFSEETGGERPEEQEMIQLFAEERERCYMLRDFFEQMDYEFQSIARREPHRTVNREKIEQMNLILEPLRKLMAGEEYAAFLKALEIPREEDAEDGAGKTKGMTYSDVTLLMSQYRSAINRFFQKIY